METIKEVWKQADERMQKVIEATKKDFAAIRTGRANPAILDRVTVECYDAQMPFESSGQCFRPGTKNDPDSTMGQVTFVRSRAGS